MNFYLGDSINQIDIHDKSVEVNDDLLQFINDKRNKLGINLNALLEIERYSDVIIPFDKIKEIEKVCTRILNSDILNEYEENDEAKATIKEVIEICKEANLKRVGLVSIGD